jgi:hypothetical protein
MAKKQTVESIGMVILFIVLLLVFLAGIYFIYVYSFYPVSTPTPTMSNIQDVDQGNNTDVSSCPNLLIQRGSQLYMFDTNKPTLSGANPVIFDSLDDYIYYVKVQRTDYGRHCPILFLQQESTTQGEDVYRVRPSPFDLEAGTPTPTAATPTQLAAVKTYFNNGSAGDESAPTQSPTLSSTLSPTTKLQGYSSGTLSQFSLATKAPVSLMNAQSQPLVNPGVGVPVPIPTLSTPKPVPYIDANSSHPPYNDTGYFAFDPFGQYQGVFTTVDVIHDETRKDTVNGFSDNAMDPNWGGVIFTANQVASGKYAEDNVFKPVFSGSPNVYTNPNFLPSINALPAAPLSSTSYDVGPPSNFTINPSTSQSGGYQSSSNNSTNPSQSSGNSSYQSSSNLAATSTTSPQSSGNSSYQSSSNSNSSATFTPTPSMTATSTPGMTATSRPSMTATSTPGMTATSRPSMTATSTPSMTATSTPSMTATSTPSMTATSTPSMTATSRPSMTATSSPGMTATSSPGMTATSSPGMTATSSPGMTATSRPSMTATSSPSMTTTRQPLGLKPGPITITNVNNQESLTTKVKA